jgi:hypothetical protein
VSDEDRGARQWIVEPPPAAGEVSIYVALGDGAELTAEQEVALGALLRALEVIDTEVVGHAACTGQTECELKCKTVRCSLDCAPMTVKKVADAPGTSWSLMGSFGSPT